MRPPNSQTTHGRFIASSWQTMCSVDGSQSTQPFGLFAVPAVHVTPSQEPEQATGGRRLAAGLRKVSFQIWPRCGLGKVIGSRKSMSCSSPCMRLYWRIWNACWVKRALAGGCEGYSSPDDLVDSRGEAWTLSVRTPAGLSKSQHLTFVRYSISQYSQVHAANSLIFLWEVIPNVLPVQTSQPVATKYVGRHAVFWQKSSTSAEDACSNLVNDASPGRQVDQVGLI